jgi:hypothetical protein
MTPSASSTFSPSRVLLVILLLAFSIRLVCWNLIDTIYRDSVRYLLQASGINSSRLLQSCPERPGHPLALFLTHKILFPHETQPDPSPLNPFAWELTAFVTGLIFSLASVAMVYALGRQVHSIAAGLWAAFFLAVLPFGVTYSIHGLTEPTYIFFFLVSLYGALRASPEKPFQLLLLGVWIFLTLLVRKDAVILPPVIGIYLLSQSDLKFSVRLKLLMIFFCGTVLAVIAFSLCGGRLTWLFAQIPALDFNRLSKSLAAIAASGPFPPLATTWLTHRIQLGYLPLLGWFTMSGIVPAVFFLLFLARPRVFQMNRGSRLLVLAMVSQVLMVVAFTAGMGYFTTRYLFPAAVAILPVAGAVTVHLLDRLKVKYRMENSALAPLAAALVLLAFWIPNALVSSYHQRQPEIRAAADWVFAHTPGDSHLLVTDNRIGFYSRRNFSIVDNVIYMDVLSGALTLAPDKSYMAMFYKDSEKAEILQRLADRAQVYHFKPLPLHSITCPNKKIDIFFLQALFPKTQPVKPQN